MAPLTLFLVFPADVGLGVACTAEEFLLDSDIVIEYTGEDFLLVSDLVLVNALEEGQVWLHILCRLVAATVLTSWGTRGWKPSFFHFFFIFLRNVT